MYVFAEFVHAGGTPMPAAMTERLLVRGLNAYVRNPIYLAVLTILIGRPAVRPARHAALQGCVWLGAAALVRWYEEPVLAARFGADYEAYRRAVPARRPRLGPWRLDN